MNKFTKEDLQLFQAETLGDKFQRTLAKVGEWYGRWNYEVYVSFSGGIDSTVLADICARWCKIIDKPLYLVFVNTGLEYPEIQRHVKDFAQWLRDKYGIEVVLDILRPKMRFDEVIKNYGYPMISKEVSNTIAGAKKSIKNGVYSHRLCKLGVSADEYGGLYDSGKYNYAENIEGSKYTQYKWRPLIDLDCDFSDICCNIMKKEPMNEYSKRTGRMPIIGTMAEESMNRENAWFKHGCNAFDAKKPKSTPMAFWLKQDVLQYIKQENIPIASVYGDVVYSDNLDQMCLADFGLGDGSEKLCTTGCDRTGCIFCGFGCHREKGMSRFQRLKETHPRQYAYCMDGGEYVYRTFKKDENGEWSEFNLAWEYDDGTPMTEQEIERFVQVHSVGFDGQKEEDLWLKFEKVWQPNKQGLGMRHVLDELNKIYGEDFIKYE